MYKFMFLYIIFDDLRIFVLNYAIDRLGSVDLDVNLDK